MAKPRAKARPRTKGKGTSRSTLPQSSKRSAAQAKGYEIVCSECYSSFLFPKSARPEKISCPECLHVGEVTGSESLSKIAIAKSAERATYLKALLPALLFLACGLGWIGLATFSETVSSGVNYGFLGATSILFIILVAMAIKYENNRHEVYF